MSDTISQLLQLGCEQLSSSSDSARLDSEILLADVLQENRTYLFTWPERLVNAAQRQNFIDLLDRRRAGEPIAYIVGEQEFWSMPLKVTPDTLIPRPETELLVELALQRIPSGSKLNILDLGTGTGAIALAIARERPGCTVTGIDQSLQAITIAKENAVTLGIGNVSFMSGHWFRSITADQKFDIIVSNPPYIALHDPHLSQGDVRFEPATALTSGDDGLDDIREISDQARHFLAPEGWLLIEHGYDQGEQITDLLTTLDYQNITDYNDLAKLPRIITAQIN